MEGGRERERENRCKVRKFWSERTVARKESKKKVKRQNKEERK